MSETYTKKNTVMAKYEYDAANRMVKGTAYLGTSVDYETSEYIYNALGDLVGNVMTIAKNGYGYHDVQADPNAPKNGKTSVIEKKYVLDYTSALKNVIMEAETNGINYRYTYGHEKLSVTISPVEKSAGELVTANKEVKLYYHHDRLGTTQFLTDDVKGKVTSYVDYDEWGKSTGKAVLKLGLRQLDLVKEYTGYTYDSVLNVYYAKARMYDPNNRRFLAVDPIKGTVANPQSMVQYSYVLGNPLKYTDPLGLRAESETSNSMDLGEGTGGGGASNSNAPTTTPAPTKPAEVAKGGTTTTSTGATVTEKDGKITVGYNDFVYDGYNTSDYTMKDGKVQFSGSEIDAFIGLADKINGWTDEYILQETEKILSSAGVDKKMINLYLSSMDIKQAQQLVFNDLIEGVRLEFEEPRDTNLSADNQKYKMTIQLAHNMI